MDNKRWLRSKALRWWCWFVVTVLLSLPRSLFLHGHMAATSEAHPSLSLFLSHQKPFSCYAIAIAPLFGSNSQRRSRRYRRARGGADKDRLRWVAPPYPRNPNFALIMSVTFLTCYNKRIKIYFRETLRAHFTRLFALSVYLGSLVWPNNGGLVFAGNRKLPGDHIRQEAPSSGRAVPQTRTTWDAAEPRGDPLFHSDFFST